ncbi:DUF7701 domain-containing protein [Nonomuraea africana]
MHDAWSAWTWTRDSHHPALVPFANLRPETRAADDRTARPSAAHA